jgi:acetylornithine deacetylase
VSPEHWTAGGPVNAIEKAQPILHGLQCLREEWRTRPDTQHHTLHPSSLVPTAITSGQWLVSYPADCTLEVHVQYTPGHADDAGFGTTVEREIIERVAAIAAADPWLRAHPPRVEFSGDSPPSFHDPDEPICAVLLDAMATAGLERTITRRTTFFDGSIFSRAGTPAIAFGPGDIKHAHAVDEHVILDDATTCAAVLAVAAMRFCGLAG